MKSANSIVFIICGILFLICSILQYLVKDGEVSAFLYAGAGILFLVSAWQSRNSKTNENQCGVEGTAILLSKEASITKKIKVVLVLLGVILVFASLGYLVGKTLAIYL